MSEYAEKVYYTLAGHLHGVGALYPADSILIAHAAYWMGLWVETMQANGEDYIQTTPNGYTQVSAVFTIIDKAESHIAKYFRMLGIGPRARQEILAFLGGRGGEAPDPLDSLLNRHRGKGYDE